MPTDSDCPRSPPRTDRACPCLSAVIEVEVAERAFQERLGQHVFPAHDIGGRRRQDRRSLERAPRPDTRSEIDARAVRMRREIIEAYGEPGALEEFDHPSKTAPLATYGGPMRGRSLSAAGIGLAWNCRPAPVAIRRLLLPSSPPNSCFP